MRLVIAALALSLLTACSPTTEQTPDAGSGQSAEAACAARNGTMQRVGRLQTLQCVVRYADAGERCTDGDQCLGDCLAPADSALSAGQAATGQCAADSNRFGCATRVEDGRADATLCID